MIAKKLKLKYKKVVKYNKAKEGFVFSFYEMVYLSDSIFTMFSYNDFFDNKYN